MPKVETSKSIARGDNFSDVQEDNKSKNYVSRGIGNDDEISEKIAYDLGKDEKILSRNKRQSGDYIPDTQRRKRIFKKLIRIEPIYTNISLSQQFTNTELEHELSYSNYDTRHIDKIPHRKRVIITKRRKLIHSTQNDQNNDSINSHRRRVIITKKRIIPHQTTWKNNEPTSSSILGIHNIRVNHLFAENSDEIPDETVKSSRLRRVKKISKRLRTTSSTIFDEETTSPSTIEPTTQELSAETIFDPAAFFIPESIHDGEIAIEEYLPGIISGDHGDEYEGYYDENTELYDDDDEQTAFNDIEDITEENNEEKLLTTTLKSVEQPETEENKYEDVTTVAPEEVSENDIKEVVVENTEPVTIENLQPLKTENPESIITENPESITTENPKPITTENPKPLTTNDPKPENRPRHPKVIHEIVPSIEEVIPHILPTRTTEIYSTIFETKTVVQSRLRTYTFVVTRVHGTEQIVTSTTEIKPHTKTVTLTESQVLTKTLTLVDFGTTETLPPLSMTSTASLVDPLQHNTNTSEDEFRFDMRRFGVVGEEARYNLATRVMSNGVEVIVAGDKSTYPGEPDIRRVLPSTNYKPITLAPSTLTDHMMMLLPQQDSSVAQSLSSSLYANQFVTKTCLTTFTYLTTYLQGGSTTVSSHEQVVSNVATEERNTVGKILPTPTAGITLTQYPNLAIGVFRTTYTYLNTLMDGEQPLVVTSKHTVANTVTAPDDYLSLLQPSEQASAVQDTNTYLSTVSLTKTLTEGTERRVISTKDVLTQVVITESVPPKATSVMTSYIALDFEDQPPAASLGYSTTDVVKTYFVTYTYYNTFLENGKTIIHSNVSTSSDVVTEKLYIHPKRTEIKGATKSVINSLPIENNKPMKGKIDLANENLEIYATKTLMTTYTSYTTLLNNGENGKRSTTISSNTRVVENVVTEKIEPNLLDKKYILSLRSSLKEGLIYITNLATLSDGKKVEITARNKEKVKATKTNNFLPIESTATIQIESVSSAAITLDSSTPNVITGSTIIFFDDLENVDNSRKATPSLGKPPKVTKTASKNDLSALLSAEIMPMLSSSLSNPFKSSILISQTVTKNGATLNPGEQVIVLNVEGNKTVIPVSDPAKKKIKTSKPANGDLGMSDLLSLGSISINSLTALTPVFNAIGGLIKTNLQNNRRNDSVPTTSKPKNPFLMEDDQITLKPPPAVDVQNRSPIYIPVGGLADIEVAESQNIASFHLNEYEDGGSHSSQVVVGKPTHESPLLNGGISISPGQVITANSDVIVGKPGRIGPRIPSFNKNNKPHEEIPIGMKPPPLPRPVHDGHVVAEAVPEASFNVEKHKPLLDDYVGPPPPHNGIGNGRPGPGRPAIMRGDKHNTPYTHIPLTAPREEVVPLQQHHANAVPTFQKLNIPISDDLTFNYEINSHQNQNVQAAENNFPRILLQQQQNQHQQNIDEAAGLILSSQVNHINLQPSIGGNEHYILPEVIERSTGQPLLVNIQPSQVAYVNIPHNRSTALIFGGSTEPHKNGQYFDDPSPYPEPEFSAVENYNNGVPQFASIYDGNQNQPNQKQVGGVIKVGTHVIDSNSYIHNAPQGIQPSKPQFDSNYPPQGQDLNINVAPISFGMVNHGNEFNAHVINHDVNGGQQHIQFNAPPVNYEVLRNDNKYSESQNRVVYPDNSLPHGSSLNIQSHTVSSDQNIRPPSNADAGQNGIVFNVPINGGKPLNEHGNNRRPSPSEPHFVRPFARPDGQQRPKPNVSYQKHKYPNRPRPRPDYKPNSNPSPGLSEFMTPPAAPVSNSNGHAELPQRPVHIPLNPPVFENEHVVVPIQDINVAELDNINFNGAEIIDHKEDDLANSDGEVIQESNPIELRPGQVPSDVIEVEGTTTEPPFSGRPIKGEPFSTQRPYNSHQYNNKAVGTGNNVVYPEIIRDGGNGQDYFSYTPKINAPRPFANGPIVRPENQQSNMIMHHETAPSAVTNRPSIGSVDAASVNHAEERPRPTVERPAHTPKPTYILPINPIYGNKAHHQRPTPKPSTIYRRPTYAPKFPDRRPPSTSMPVDPVYVSTQRPSSVEIYNTNSGSQTEEPFRFPFDKTGGRNETTSRSPVMFNFNSEVSFPDVVAISTRKPSYRSTTKSPPVSERTTKPNANFNIGEVPISQFQSTKPNLPSTQKPNQETSYTAPSANNSKSDSLPEVLQPPPPAKEILGVKELDTNMKPPPQIEVNSPSGGIHRVPSLNDKKNSFDLDVQANTPKPYVPQPSEEMKPPPGTEEVMGMNPPPITTHRPILSTNISNRPHYSTPNRPPYVFEMPTTTTPFDRTQLVTRQRRPITRRPVLYRTSSTPTTSTTPATTKIISSRPPFKWQRPVTPVDFSSVHKPSRRPTIERVEINRTTPAPSVSTNRVRTTTKSHNQNQSTTSKPNVSSIRPDSELSESESSYSNGKFNTTDFFNNNRNKYEENRVAPSRVTEIESSMPSSEMPFATGVHHAGNEISVIDDTLPTRRTRPTAVTSKVILPTRYITHTKTLTVTTTKTTVVKSLGSPPSTLTLLVTKTHTSTIVDTVTQTQTLVKPTSVVRTVTTTINHTPTTITTTIAVPAATNTIPAYAVKPTPTINTDMLPTLIVEGTTDMKDDEDFLDEFIISDEDDPPNNSKDHSEHTIHIPEGNESILIVMTDKKNGGVVHHVPPPPHVEPTGIEEDDFETPKRDEVLDNNEVNRILLGGVLIANPPLLDSPKSKSSECLPECKASRNELCQKVEGIMRCICRPGFARMFPDRPCKPTYTYSMKLGLDRYGKEPVVFEDTLKDSTSSQYARLAAATHDGLDRLVMQSDLRDIYHGVHVNGFERADDGNNVINSFYVQLSDNTDENRLKDVFKKYLRNNNYSLGGTELYASKHLLQELNATDYDECSDSKFHDCSEHAQCFNLKGTYTCSCKEGFADMSENVLYPGRVCSAELIGCERCHYHGTCYNRGDDQILCECFQWYAGESCHVNLKVLLIALVTLGAILFTLLLVCIILTCVRKRPRNSGVASGMSFLPQRVVNPGRQRDTLDRRAMIQETSSEGSQSDNNTLPYVAKKNKKPKGALKKSSSSGNNVDLENGNSNSQMMSSAYSDQKDRSLTVMIPRAKYHPAPPTSPLLNMAAFDKRKSSAASSNEAKLLSYLDAGPTPNRENTRRKHSHSPSESYIVSKPSQRKTSAGALVSAGFEVSATGGGNSLVNMGTLGTLCGTEADRSENATLIQNKISADLLSSTGTRSQFTTLRKSLMENDDDPISNWLDIPPRVTTVSESRSYDETTIQPPTKSLRSLYDSKPSSSQHRNNDEQNTMAERDLGSTFLLPHTHLYKPDRGSDISGFDSL